MTHNPSDHKELAKQNTVSSDPPERMIKNTIRSYIDGCQLTDDTRRQIWQKIHQKETRRGRVPLRKVLGAAAVFVCILFVGGMGVDAAGGGKVAQSIQRTIREICGMAPESAEIIKNMTPEAEVYAPPLLECSDKRLIFATSRGMVIYDRTKERVAATIDLQKTDCRYFRAETLSTKVMIDGDRLRIFNTKDQKVQGDCFEYDLSVLKTQTDTVVNLEPAKVHKAPDRLSDQWEETMAGRYLESFGNVDERTMEQWQNDENGNIKYSELSVAWQSSGQRMFSCLLLVKDIYQLYTWEPDSGKSQVTDLQMEIPEEVDKVQEDRNILPRFVYTGGDAVMKAVCEYLVETTSKEDGYGHSQQYVVIPAPLIHETVREKEELKVFGNFWSFSYYRNGNTLENEAGGEMPACIHLKKENGDWQVVQVERTGDGAYYQSGIEKFCEGYPEIARKFFDSDTNEKRREQIRKKLVKQYVKDNGLDIRYYHDFGWDPVELFH